MTSRRIMSLIVFRVIAALWMVRGLLAWVELIDPPQLDDVVAGGEWRIQIITVLFAIADVVGAVGLWLAAPWGVVVWALSVGLHLQEEFALGNNALMFFEITVAAICGVSFYRFQRSRDETQSQSKFI